MTRLPVVRNDSELRGLRYYRPELDALRFFAFLAVFTFHNLEYLRKDPTRSEWVSRIGMMGAFGVPIFFLLSAFLITELILREQSATGSVHIRSFYIRRILRIWPLYLTFFYGLALINRFLPGSGTDKPLAWLAFTCFAGNWFVTLHGWIAGPVDPLWSISVEEQFYLVIPVLAALGGRRILAAASVLFLLMAYVAVFLYGLHRRPGDHGEWTNSFVQFQFFSAGTLLALLLRGRLPQWSLIIRSGGWVAGIACWVVALVHFRVQSWDPQPTAFGSLAGWLLILCGASLLFLSSLGTAARYIPRWLAYLGQISYGLYVFHSFIFFLVFKKGELLLNRLAAILHVQGSVRDAIGTTLVFFVTVLCAHFSYRYFESFFLRLKRRFTFVAARD